MSDENTPQPIPTVANGLYVGKVVKTQGDPDSESRIQIELSLPGQESMKVWARFASGYAGNGHGCCFWPQPDSDVVVGFFNNKPDQAVILGSMYSSKQQPPYDADSRDVKKAIVTKGNLRIEFDDEKKTITLDTPGDNRIRISDDAQCVTISDQNSNKVILDKDGITMDSSKDIVLKAKGKIVLDANTNVSVKAKSNIEIEGVNVKATAKVGFTAKGTATAEISASGQTVVKGAMVMIN